MRGLLAILACLVVAVAAQDDSKTINPAGCGRRPLFNGKRDTDKVVGGKLAIVGDWPWQIQMNYNQRLLCGGALINNRWIASAAHCTQGKTYAVPYDIIIGSHDRVSFESHSKVYKVDKVINHEYYNSNTMMNDISLLKLSSVVQYTNYILPACIAEAGSNFGGQTSYATGWGATSSGGSIANKLMEVAVAHLSDARCKAKYSTVDVNTAVCAGDDGVYADTCQGDSGGPLVNSVGGVWYLTGLTSWGRGCGNGGVYTRVSAYRSWILTQLAYN